MQPVRERTPDQHSYFYVVWPEDKTELPLSPSNKKETEQPSPGIESATSGSSSHETSTAGSRETQMVYSRRLTESPIQSPDVDYLTPRQQAPSPPITLDPVQPKTTFVTSNYSTSMPAHTQRTRGSLSHQLITLPVTTVPQAQILSSGVTTYMGGSSDIQKEAGASQPGDSRMADSSHNLLFQQSQRQLLHLGNPLPIARSQDINGSFRKIGALAEQAAINLQKILQTTNRFQQPVPTSTPKLVSPQTSTSVTASGTEQDTRFGGEDGGYYSIPTPKRLCAWEGVSSLGSATGCMECDVKIAEIQILRKRLQTLQEQFVSLNGRVERHYSIPILSTPTFESPRVQQNVKAERVRLPATLPSIYPEHQLSVEQLATTSGRGRKIIDTKLPQAAVHIPSVDNQPSVAMPSPQANELTELVSGSGVYILTHTLLDARKDAKSGTQLARKLMDAFWDKDTLARSTLTPRSKFQYQQLDPKIIKAIEVYCLTHDETVHSKDIHATMTDKCCQARSRIRTLQPDMQSETHKPS